MLYRNIVAIDVIREEFSKDGESVATMWTLEDSRCDDVRACVFFIYYLLVGIYLRWLCVVDGGWQWSVFLFLDVWTIRRRGLVHIFYTLVRVYCQFGLDMV